MPNNNTISETSSIDIKYRVCLTRTFTDPDLHARLKKEEKITMKKNNFHRSRSLSFSSVFSSNVSVLFDEEVFLSLEHRILQGTEALASIPRTPYCTSSSSKNFIFRHLRHLKQVIMKICIAQHTDRYTF